MNHEFRPAVREGRKLRLRTTNSSTRFAFIVSKKVSLKSIQRHQIKRRLSDAVMGLLSQFPPNLEIVVFAKREAVGRNVEELLLELKSLLPCLPVK